MCPLRMVLKARHWHKAMLYNPEGLILNKGCGMYSEGVSRRLLYTLFLSQSLISAAQISIVTLVSIVATRLGGAETAAGLPSSVVTFAQAFAALPIALIMGRYGRRLGLTVGYSGGALGGLLGMIAIVQGSFPLLLLSSALLGMARAGGDQSRFVAGEMFPRHERATMIGRIIFAGTIGAIAGPALVAPSGRFMESLGLNADLGPWAVAMVLFILAALITTLFLRPDPMFIAREIEKTEEDARKDEPVRPARPLRELLAVPNVQLAILAMLISQVVMVGLMVMTPLHMDHHNHGRESISLVISAHTLGMFGLSAVTGYLIDRFGRIPMLFVAALTMIASALLAPLSTNEYVLALALFLLGLGWNFGFVGGSSLLADTLEGPERTRVQGLNDTLIFSIAGLASLGAGPLFAIGDYVAITMSGLVLCVIMIFMIYWLTRPRLMANAL